MASLYAVVLDKMQRFHWKMFTAQGWSMSLWLENPDGKEQVAYDHCDEFYAVFERLRKEDKLVATPFEYPDPPDGVFRPRGMQEWKLK